MIYSYREQFGAILRITNSTELGTPSSKVDKEDYLLALERSPISSVEIKVLLKTALTDKINDHEVFMKGIDASYHYEGYNVYRTQSLMDEL